MKVVLILLLALGAVKVIGSTFAPEYPSLDLPAPKPKPIEEIVLKVISGLLKALKAYVSITNMQTCVTSILPDITIIKNLITTFNTTKWNNTQQVLTVGSELMDALDNIVKTVKPCSHAYTDIVKIIQKFNQIDPDKLLQRIMDNVFNIFFNLTDAIKSIMKEEYEEAAVSFGSTIFFVLLYESPKQLRTTADFLTGLLEGLNEKGDVKELLRCVTDIEAIYAKIITALQLILKLTFMDIVKGVQLLIEAVKQLIDVLQPCATGFTQLERLAKAIINTSILDIVAKIAMNIGPYIHDITDCINAFKEGNHRKAGVDIGDILFRLYLENRLALSFDDLVPLVQGFLEAVVHTGSFEHIDACLQTLPDIANRIDALIAEFQQADWQNTVRLVELLLKLINTFKDVMSAIKPCATVPEEIEHLIQKIIRIDIGLVIDNIQSHMFDIIVGLYNIYMDITGKKYHEAGKEFGNICCIIIFNN